MSIITNEPIFLDSTGRDILSELRAQNGYLAVLAGGGRAEVYKSMEQIAAVVRGSDLETIKRLFPIGDQIIAPWKDMDDPAHDTDATAYQVEWDIVHHGMVTLQDGSVVPGLYLMMHKCSAYGVQFSHQQAFLNCPDGLPAGTYHLTLSTTWGNLDAVAGSAWYFTLTKDVPAGGRVSGFEGMPDQPNTNWRVKSWANPTDAEPIETVSVSSGSAGTNLGMMPYNVASDKGMNGMQKTAFGHNRWRTSAIRQYLHAIGTGWFSSEEDFDIRPDQYNKRGFMSGFGDDFLSAIKPVKVTTALNTVEGFTDAAEDTYDAFFLPSLEQINAKPQLAGEEGDYFEYWRRRLGLSGFAAYHPTLYDGYKIPAINSNSLQVVRLRSASRGLAYLTWYVGASGHISSSYGSNSNRCTPVCVIC